MRATIVEWEHRLRINYLVRDAASGAKLNSAHTIQVAVDMATREMERCVKQLGFKGALVNGFSQTNTPENCVYYDAPQFAGFWDVVEKLDVPFYLHPRNPIGAWAQIYDGHPWLMGPTWAFGQETAVHALRLMASGLFDRHPKLQIILGHMSTIQVGQTVNACGA